MEKDSKIYPMTTIGNETLKTVKLEEGIEDLSAVKKTYGLLPSIFNLSNSAIGAGTLSLANVFAKSGLVNGILMILIATIVTGATLHFLARTAAVVGSFKYSDLGKAAFGKKGELTTVVFFLLLMFIPLIAYHLVCGGYMRTILINAGQPKDSAQTNVCLWAFLIATFVILPLAMIKDIGTLSKASLVCLICIFYTVFLIVIDFFVRLGSKKLNFDGIVFFKSDLSLIQSFAVICMAFISHTTVLDIFSVMKAPTEKRKFVVNSVSSLVVGLTYMLVGVSGYLLFGTLNEKEDNILVLGHGPAYGVAQVLFCIMIALTYPLFLFPCRDYFDWILNQVLSTEKLKKWYSLKSGRLDWCYLIVSLFFIYIPLAIACSGASLATVFGVGSCLFGSSIVFVLPCSFFLKLKDQVKATRLEIVMCYICLAVGLFLLTVGSAVCLYLAIKQQ